MNKKGLNFPVFLTSLILASLFIISLYAFSTKTAENYGQDTDLVDDNMLDLTSLEAKVDNASSHAEGWQDRVTSDNPFVAVTSIILFSTWGVFKLMWTSTSGIVGIYFNGMYNILGIDPMVTGTISALLIIGLIFAIWKVVKTGE